MTHIETLEKTENTNVRESNLELLRIIATIFVIILHYNNVGIGGGFRYTADLGYHYHVLLGFEMISICAVNIFIMISGYFMCAPRKTDISKPILLYLEVILFTFLKYGMNLATKGVSFSLGAFLRCLLPLNWYVTVYIALYLISPFLNKIIRGISLPQFRKLLIVSMVCFSVWPSILDAVQAVTGIDLSELSPLGIQGSGNGYTIVNFVLMYFIGAYLKVSAEESKHASIFRSVAAYLICSILLILYTRISFSGALSYCNPIVILQAVALFRVFQSLQIKSIAINVAASCSFGVYLLHTNFFPYFLIEHFVTGQLFWIPIHVLVTAILIYTACAVIYWLYAKTLRSTLIKVLKKINILTYEFD